MNIKRTVKDSVFTNLFKDKRYVLELYKALFPYADDNDELTIDDIDIITIENILTNGMYNDLGFKVRDRIIVLVEAQSTWSENIIVRLLLYIAYVYQKYIESNKLDLYSSKNVKLPVPELFVIYTGNKKIEKDTISLSDTFFGGKKTVDVNVKVITDGTGNDIVAQYVSFTKIVDNQIKLYGRTEKAAQEIIRICKNQEVLKQYLMECESEVVDMMITLFDQEKALEIHLAARDAEMREKFMEEGIAKGMEKGIAKGMEKGMENMIQMMQLSGMSEEQINNVLAQRAKVC